MDCPWLTYVTYVLINVTGSLGCRFTSWKPLRLAVPLQEFCSCPLDLFHPLGLAGCAQLMLPAWILHLPRTSQACSREGCVSEHGVWSLHSQTHQLLQWGGQLQMCQLSARLWLDRAYCKQLLQLAPGNTLAPRGLEMPGTAGTQRGSHSPGLGSSQVWTPRKATALLFTHNLAARGMS